MGSERAGGGAWRGREVGGAFSGRCKCSSKCKWGKFQSQVYTTQQMFCAPTRSRFFFLFLLPLNVELPLPFTLPSSLLPAAYCAPLSKALCMRHTQLLLLLLLYKPKRTKTFAAGWAAHSAGHKSVDSKIVRRIPGRKPTFRLPNAFCPWRRLSPPIVPIQVHI